MILLCSNCFRDHGLSLMADAIGSADDSACPNCKSRDGQKLTARQLKELAQRFFVFGTFSRTDYGGAPLVQWNETHGTDIRTAPWFESDVRLLEETLGIGFFHYGPRLWMVGEIEPLKALQNTASRPEAIKSILEKYPAISRLVVGASNDLVVQVQPLAGSFQLTNLTKGVGENTLQWPQETQRLTGGRKNRRK